MTSDIIRAAIRTRPFVPFTIVMADGGQHRIPHPDCLLLSHSGRTAYLINPDDTFTIIDLLLMTEVRLDEYVSPSGA